MTEGQPSSGGLLSCSVEGGLCGHRNQMNTPQPLWGKPSSLRGPFSTMEAWPRAVLGPEKPPQARSPCSASTAQHLSLPTPHSSTKAMPS